MNSSALLGPVIFVLLPLVAACTGTTGVGAPPPELHPCSAEALIDDGEDNDNQAAVGDGRGGYWYTYADLEGSTITPTAGAQGGIFQPSPGGANGSSYAMRFHGAVASAATVFAGMGLNFTDPKGAYDASHYEGLTFWAKKSPGTTPRVRVKLPDVNTDPDGGVCSACYNDHGRAITLANQWTQHYMSFDSLSQERGWGSPKTGSVAVDRIYALQFQINEKGSQYDVWIDDIAFLGCR